MVERSAVNRLVVGSSPTWDGKGFLLIASLSSDRGLRRGWGPVVLHRLPWHMLQASFMVHNPSDLYPLCARAVLRCCGGGWGALPVHRKAMQRASQSDATSPKQSDAGAKPPLVGLAARASQAMQGWPSNPKRSYATQPSKAMHGLAALRGASARASQAMQLLHRKRCTGGLRTSAPIRCSKMG